MEELELKIRSAIKEVTDATAYLNEEWENKLTTKILLAVKESFPVELPVGIVKSGNEVTDFGVDYDGAIEAGKDGWQCGNCGKWNRKERYVCKHCVDYDE